jgi:methyl-accepting chemotaxis protein
MLKNRSILQKIMVLGAIALGICTTCMGLVLLKSEQTLYATKAQSARELVQFAVNLVGQYETAATYGKMPQAQAQEQAKEAIRQIRYDRDNFFFITDKHSHMIMEPMRPELEGTDMSDFKDPSGKRIFAEFSKVCAGSKGEGFVAHMWPKPGHTKPVPKVSFVMLTSSWDWIVGTGVYVDEIRAQTNRLTLLILLPSLILISWATWAIAKSISIPLKKVVTAIDELSQCHLGIRLNMKRKDELGVLAGRVDHLAAFLNDNVVAILNKVGEGDVTTFIKLQNDKDEISPALINIHKAINGLMHEMKDLSKAGVEGRLSVRGQAQNYRGGFQEIIQGVNDTLNAVITPINEAATVLDKMAAKDVTARMQGEYQGEFAKIKESLNQAAQHLEESLLKVSQASRQVSSTANEIRRSSQTLAAGASEQASSLEEISSSLQEITSMTKQNAGNAQETKGVADAACARVDMGLVNMRGLSSAMDQIKQSSRDTAKIVKTIDEIAFQTNLLALNAAVEAARAGDAGKGFAVVAEEVRNLAMRSAEAAKNTTALIESSIQSTESGVALNNEVLKSLEEINVQAKKVSAVVAEIAAGSAQQAHGIEQLNSAIQQLSTVTQQNAASSEQTAGAAEEMDSQAQELKSLVGGFYLNEQAPQSRPEPESAAARPTGRQVITLDDGDTCGLLS